MAGTVQSLFGDMFKTPEQIRREQQEALMNEGRQSAGMLMAGGGSGLAQAIKGHAANIAQYIPSSVDQLKRGGLQAAGMLAGMAGNQGAKQSLNMASMSPEERQASMRQSILSNMNEDDPASMAKALEEAKKAGLPKVVEYIQQKMTAKKSTARQQAVEDRDYALKWMAEQRMQNKSDAEIRKILAEANKLDKLTPLDERIRRVEAGIAEETQADVISETRAGAQSAIAQAAVDQATVGLRVQDLQATINQKAAQTGLTTSQTSQVNQAVSQAAQMFPKEMAAMDNQAARDKASTALTVAQTTSETTLLPHKVAKITAESQLLGYQQDATKALTEERKASILNMNQTDFLRELDASNISEEEKQALIKQRLEGRSKTADVAGYTPDSAITEVRVNKAVEIAEQGIDAQRSLARSENILVALDRAATGKFAGTEAFIKSWMGQLGFEDAQRDTIANEMFQVLRGEITLDAASNLKGAMSDKDLAFLQETIPARDMSVAGLRAIFGQMAAQHAADVYASENMDKFLTSATASELRGTEINNLTAAYRVQGEALYMFELKQQGRLPEDFVIKMPTQAQRDLIKRYKR